MSVAANGSFTYNPPPGFSGTDTFTYVVNDGEGNTNSATVSITVGQVVWFINNAAGGPGDGRFTSPFNSVANFNALAADDPGDYIFVYQGTAAYGDALTLLNNQQLIGHGDGLTISPNLEGDGGGCRGRSGTDNAHILWNWSPWIGPGQEAAPKGSLTNHERGLTLRAHPTAMGALIAFEGDCFVHPIPPINLGPRAFATGSGRAATAR